MGRVNVGGGFVKINGQDKIIGTLQESVNKFDTVYFNKTFNNAITKNSNNISAEYQPYDMIHSLDNKYAAAAIGSTPYVGIYKITNGVYSRLANPSVLPTSTGIGVALSSDGTYLVVGHSSSPYITIYKRSGDTFTKLANPATLPPQVANGVRFSSDDTYLYVAHTTTPFISIYKRSGDTFTKLANPASLPTGNGDSIDVTRDGTYVAIGHGTSRFLTIYKRSVDTFTKLSDPSTLPTGYSNGVRFDPSGTYLATTVAFSTPCVYIYKRSGDTFTKLSTPSTTGANIGFKMDFSGDSDFFALAINASPYLEVYSRSGDTFTLTSYPTSKPTAPFEGLAYNYDGSKLLTGGDGTQNIWIYDVSYLYNTYKANNSLVLASTGRGAGYALASGTASQNVEILRIFR